MPLCDCEECLKSDNRLSRIEAKLVEFEEYFTTMESILTKIQTVFEHIKERVDLD